MDLKKLYYYIICLVSLFVFAMGAVDLTSSGIGLFTTRFSASSIEAIPPTGESEPGLDLYYQKKMLYDRLSDSLARIIISGLVFVYSRSKVNQLEKT